VLRERLRVSPCNASAVTFDLAVWEGDRPPSDAAAAEIYEQLMDRLEGGEQEPPTDRIRAYVSALLDRWPDIDEDGGEDSPWADGPLIDNAFGSVIYFAMVWSQAEEASEFAARVAEEHGLVCFDPQSECLRPVGTTPVAPARDAAPPQSRSRWRTWFGSN
jgi:hypothetical protein